MTPDRRSFLMRFGAAALALRPASSVLASGASSVDRKLLVTILLRGGADALNIVVPHGEKLYYSLRPNIAIPRGAVIDLDGFFGFHPLLAPLKPAFDARRLAVVHAVGTRRASVTHSEAHRNVVAELSHVFRDSSPTFTDESPDTVATMLRQRTGGVAAYPRTKLGRSLASLAGSIHAGAAPPSAHIEMDGWDHHVNEVGTTIEQGALASRVHDLAASLAAFDRDLGPGMSGVTVVIFSEFGRSVRENRSRGTGHGRASFLFVMGGDVNGGKVLGRWPGLGLEQLDESAGLAVTTGYAVGIGQTAPARRLFSHLPHAHAG